MTTLKHEIRINAPLAVVWKAVADLEAVRHYNPQVAAVKILSEKREGIGATRRCELRPKGWVEEQVWEWNPDASIGLEVAASDWPIVFMKWRTTLQQDGKITLVRQSLDYQPKFGPLGALLNTLIMRRKLDQGIREVFQGLKRHAER
jgi:ligand-binding SRPBCC domain-containing protein